MENYDKYLGRILDNRYEILELIGVGGMAYVYKARCHRLNRLVAIKILKEDLASDEEFQRRFYTESQAVAMLSHPNIVAVYDVSRSGNTEYIVMELIEGITLKQYINRKGLLNWKEALHFVAQITKALAHAHSRGIIHRDIKPHNIMILKDGSVKVADFGIARLLSVQNTLTQEALGSVHYISPEQAKGGHIDARSDIYSVGVVMYEMLTSRLPFVGESAVSVAIQHISAIPLLPRDINPDIPLGLEEITMHAMEPDVDMRFTTAEEMLNDLEEFRRNPGVVFHYDLSNPSNRQPVEYSTPYETRNIPRDPLPVRPVTPIPVSRSKPEMTRDEHRDSKRRSNNTATLVGIFVVVVFIVILLAYFVLPPMNTWLRPSEDLIQIPRFIGERLIDLQNNAEYADTFIFVQATTTYSDDVEEGRVISQNPEPDDQRGRSPSNNKITIRLTISDGPAPPAVMPNFADTGISWTRARSELRAMGLDLDIREESVVDERPINEVIETDPVAGATLRQGDIVILRYSTGPNRAPELIPRELVGSTEESVMEALRALGMNPRVAIRDTRPEPAGTVYFIAHAGDRVPPGSNIDIHVSTGPAAPPATPEPTPVPTPQLFTVNVVGGSGSGDFAVGSSVQITANAPAEGQQFKEWVITPAVAFTAGGETTASATFSMPANTVSVTATYEPIPPPPVP